jgi:hypothetical protein
MARLSVPVEQLRFVRIGDRRAGAEILKAGLRLISRREVVWQIDIDGRALRADAAAAHDLADVIGAHLTHVKEMGLYPAEPWRKALKIDRLFQQSQNERPTGLLLFNLR